MTKLGIMSPAIIIILLSLCCAFAIDEETILLKPMDESCKNVVLMKLLDECLSRTNCTESSLSYPSSCAEATANTRRSGIYQIQLPSLSLRPFMVACNEGVQGGAWTVVQQRLDGSVDFFRYWNDYKNGFGHVDSEYFLGLERLHIMTATVPQELLIVMEDFDGVRRHANYDEFAVGDEQQAYALNRLGKYSGDAGDSLTEHLGHKYTTRDRHNDANDKNCAVLYTGAWWYYNCHVSNLNGQYLGGAYNESNFAQGIVWNTFRGYYYALKYVQMMIRPKRT